MFNDRALENGQRFLESKQTGTARGYIRKLRAIASGLDQDDVALKFHFYHSLSDEVKDIIYLEERLKTRWNNIYKKPKPLVIDFWSGRRRNA